MYLDLCILYFVFCILYFVFCILYFVFCIFCIKYFLYLYIFFVFCMLYVQPRPESLSAPDGVCEDGEGWACSGEIVSESHFHFEPEKKKIIFFMIFCGNLFCKWKMGLQPRVSHFILNQR